MPFRHKHDLRHTFAVSTMLDAYTSGAEPAAVLPLLATWLGHPEPSDTYWYYSDFGVIPMSVPLHALMVLGPGMTHCGGGRLSG